VAGRGLPVPAKGTNEFVESGSADLLKIVHHGVMFNIDEHSTMMNTGGEVVPE
jgi:hypothetical protein